ncbi:MAG: dTMP kinase [Candidatus Endonucleobacter bathymodioli]|uniref:Thymidylate kinase n=1 Tax=Candidatus Endonucleibacter bathymodioli TaxID=539814 RepID=A0AA90NRE5_9GAMM|nr:dTMP kinase [Candidatus Endonucleobacter bathymodioli]
MGFFLTIEGIEGAGKTTAVGFIRGWFEANGIAYEQTREPGGTLLAEEIRELLLAKRQESVVDTTELLLLFAARSQNFHEKIKPAMAAGKVLLCDRFTDATYAYQGGGRGIDSSKIEVLENLVQGDCRPDLTLLLDIDPTIGLGRARSRGDELDRIEQEEIVFFERVRSTYLERAKQYPERYIVIDASASVDNVLGQIEEVLKRRLV